MANTAGRKPAQVKKTVAENREESKPVAATAAEKKPTQAKQPVKSAAALKPEQKADKPAAEKKPTAPKKPSEEKKAETAKPAPVVAQEPSPQSTEKIKVKVAEKRKILFVCSEAFPFAGTGGLGEVMGSLPREINRDKNNGYEARIILPLYESFPADERKNLEFICHINVPLAWRNQYCGLFKYDYNGTVYYFIDNEYYFKRPNLYGYYDDGERFAFLSRAVVELLPSLGWKPDVLHCQDWQTALVPIYYKLFYMYRQGYEGIRTIFTIHNIEYQGKYAKSIIEDVFGIPQHEYMSIEHRGCINLMKGAIDYCDAVSTVSPTYAREIMDPFYAHGLENVLLKNSYKLRGILNGVDVDGYNPETNPSLFKNYSVKTYKTDKVVNKVELQKMLSLPVNEKVPMIAVISRLVSHKGLDLVRFAMNDLLKNDVQVVILGKGDPDYEGFFTHIQQMYDRKVCSVIAFNKDLSHKIYAAADMFLMPSKSEPCGLSQMMACRYGTIPIVRLTGGLRDSITDCGDGDYGNGFTFAQYNAGDMMHALDRAIGLYRDYHDKWEGLVKRAMTTDFSWVSSAREYVKFYNEMF
ncbi:MAG: glycogen synthase GlgA [Clostridia bacterium]|nr:glycogen synthase GlgA [Clostridia bacterium]